VNSASAAVLARLPFITKLNSPDFLWDTVDIAIWSTVEQGLAITAGSLATLRPLFQLFIHKCGLSTRPTQQSPSKYGLATPPASAALNSRRRPSKNELDVYTLSQTGGTRLSDESLAKDGGSKSSNWFDGGKSQGMTSSQVRADNESERSLNANNNSRTSDDNTGIMVSRTFFITDEERASIASRDNGFR
jgi:hypothetical protein